MKIAVIGSAQRLEELRSLTSHPLHKADLHYRSLLGPWEPNAQLACIGTEPYDAVVQFTSVVDGDLPGAVALSPHVPLVLVGLLGCTAAEVASRQPHPCNLFTFNDLPGFWESTTWEVAAAKPTDAAEALAPLAALGLQFTLVPDRPGLVTPRVLAQIINEAYYMVGEGGAEANAIDQAMRLGVNYPKGPLEWAGEIGPVRVLAVLRALQAYAGTDGYRAAPALVQAAFAFPQ